MPNWCSTDYYVLGSRKEIMDLSKRMERLENRKKSLINNGFGNTWLGNLVNNLGGDWENVYCRGEWMCREWNKEKNTLTFTTETAWQEMKEWRRFIESCYKTIKILYVTEEPGMGIYKTNDLDEIFFKAKFVLDYGEDVEYFETLDQAIVFIEELTGITIEEKTVNGIQGKLDEYVEENDEEDLFYSFHEFEQVDD
nr:MAG TPA: Ferredoxin-like domain in Api92-like protein [Caudoviricetes sp.]